MKQDNQHILTINGGSSSIKFALYEMAKSPKIKLSGSISRIGMDKPEFTLINHVSKEKKKSEIKSSGFREAAGYLIDRLQKETEFNEVKCIGHRIVHGMQHTEAELITDDLIKELKNISNYDPDHLPAEMEMIKLLKEQYPNLIQVACFDTTFHTTIPPVAKKFAIPKKYYNEGVQRYGFHGISYSYLMQELIKKNDEDAKGKIILAHLGNGASIAAVKDGKCIDTSMGFSPAGGIPMSTRSGGLDPGVAWYFMKKGLNVTQFNDLINHQSGLLGISGISSDMQELLQKEKLARPAGGENKDAALAIEIFCYQVKKYIGAYTAALGGLDILVFSGGIGEHAPVIRSRICEKLNYLGIELDEERNKNNKNLISSNAGRVKVYVIPTNEELMIAKTAMAIYNNHN